MNTVLKFEEWTINERMGEDDRAANKIRLKVRKQFEKFFTINWYIPHSSPWDWKFSTILSDDQSEKLIIDVYSTSNYRIIINFSEFQNEEDKKNSLIGIKTRSHHEITFNLEDALSVNLVEEMISDLIIEDKESILRIIETKVGKKLIEDIRFKIRGKKIGIKTGIT